MAAGLGFLTLRDYRRGRNGADPLIEIPETQCAEAINVDWYRGMLGRRRPGAQTISPSANTALGTSIFSLIRFVPGRTELQTELFAFDYPDGYIARYRGGVGWSNSSRGGFQPTSGKVQGVSFNNKLFLAGNNDADKLYYWSAVSGAIFPVGLIAPVAAPTVAASGTAGSITGTRYYRYAYIQKTGSLVTKRGEMSAIGSKAITSQTGWKITIAASGTLQESHWELYGSTANNGPWYLLNTYADGTTVVFDTLAAAAFPPANAPLAPIIGSNTPAPNGKYLLVDEARLLIAGSFTKADWHSRVWWTPILNDASGVANDERVDMAIRPFIDFDPGDAGEITGLGGPLFDSPYVFKLDRIYKMVRTGLSGASYRPVTVSKKCGAIHQRTIVLAEDENGDEAIYFLSRRGPFRISAGGVQYCGRDIEDLWATVNLNAASGTIDNAGAHGIYHQDLHQIWWWVPVAGGTCPTVKLVFDTRLGQTTPTDGVRGGWCQHTGPSAQAWCSVMFADSLSMVTDPGEDALILKPYFSQAGDDPGAPVLTDARVWMGDYGHLDNGAGYEASVRSRAIALTDTIALHGGVLEGHVIVSPGTHSFRVATLRDYGIEVRTSGLVVVTPASMPRVLLPVRDLAAVSSAVVQIEYIDDPLSEIWELDQIVLRIRREEDR
jgi:hypothetical protein